MISVYVLHIRCSGNGKLTIVKIFLRIKSIFVIICMIPVHVLQDKMFRKWEINNCEK
jgi:hypothetical protein